MKNESRRAVVLMIGFLAGSVTVGAQWIGYPTPGIPRTRDGKPDLSAPAPRTADGKPDLSGIWLTTSNKWLVNIADGVEVPWTPRARAIFDERQANFGRDRPSGKCISHGVTDFDALGTPTKIVQTPAVTVMMFEAYNHFRQIMTDGRPLPKDPEPAWLGYSVGRWEGTTFVVETNGLSDKTWLDDGGHPHSDALRVTERFTRPNFGRLNVQVTIDDREMYTRPWNVTIEKRLIADDELIEFMCENEKDLPHMVGK
jgi:hypothetical protein